VPEAGAPLPRGEAALPEGLHRPRQGVPGPHRRRLAFHAPQRGQAWPGPGAAHPWPSRPSWSPSCWPTAAGRTRSAWPWASHGETGTLVFCSPLGAPIDPHEDWEEWHWLLAAAAVREARVHDARHTAGTLLLEQGIDIRVVQQILGHSQLSQTQRYTHVTAALTKDAAYRMDKALWG